jgi:hypothetical protein
LQVVSREVAERLVKRFHSLKAKLARRFGGLPIYVGHPDDPSAHEMEVTADTRAYAWIVDMEARDEALWILSRWSRSGKEVLANAFYKFLSPRWLLRKTGAGRFEPEELVSVGLTNSPNIPGEPIANCRKQEAVGNEADSRQGDLDAAIARILDIDTRLAALEERISPEDSRCGSFQRNQPAANQLPERSRLLESRPISSLTGDSLTLVSRRMAETGEDYASAWLALNRNNPIT